MTIKKRWVYIISLFFIALIINTSCSRKALPEVKYEKQKSTSKPAIKRESKSSTVAKKSTVKKTTGNKKLDQFIASGTERTLNTGRVSADDIIKTARKYMGVPHCMGGSSKKCMDCSGLVMRVFAINGISFPHSSQEQARYGQIIQSKSQLKRGDLVYFVNTYKTSKYITHTGICIGNNQFIHTSSSRGVTITSLDNSWWKDKFIFGTRVL